MGCASGFYRFSGAHDALEARASPKRESQAAVIPGHPVGDRLAPVLIAAIGFGLRLWLASKTFLNGDEALLQSPLFPPDARVDNAGFDNRDTDVEDLCFLGQAFAHGFERPLRGGIRRQRWR